MDVEQALERSKRFPPSSSTATLAAEVRRLHTWAGLMSLLAEHYPADVPLGPDSDPGPRILRLTRELDRLRAAHDRVRKVIMGRRSVAAAAVLHALSVDPRATDGGT